MAIGTKKTCDCAGSHHKGPSCCDTNATTTTHAHDGHDHGSSACCSGKDHDHAAHDRDAHDEGDHKHHDHDHTGGGCSCASDHGHSHGDDPHEHSGSCCDPQDEGGCGCGSDHGHDHGSGKGLLWRIGISLVIVILTAVLSGLTLPQSPMMIARVVLFLAAYLIIGYDVLQTAFRNILRGRVFDENFLMAIATIGAFAIGEYAEGVAVMIFYQIGEFFQSYAVRRSRRAISSLMDIRPDTASVLRGGTYVSVAPESVQPGDMVRVRPGEKIPLDGTVTEGASSLDTTALTGESLPRDVVAGDEVLSGCINRTGLLTIRVTKPYGESTVARILSLVENASSKKAPAEQFISKFARKYTPIVVITAAVLALGLPFVTSLTFSQSLYRALVFLVISCPCALVVSVPLSFFGGIGGASRLGVLVKGSNYIQTLAELDTVVFDKTGTLTQGTFSVFAVNPASGISKEMLLDVAAHAESQSNHPISRSIAIASQAPLDAKRVGTIEEIAGHGVKAVVDGKTVFAGNDKLMGTLSLKVPKTEGTAVHIALDGMYAGHIILSDTIRPDAALAIRSLKDMGVTKTVMLTGDTKATGEAVAKTLGLDEAHCQLLPDQKVAAVERILATKTSGKLAFVGDGINDAPVLARADLGIAMGGLGSDAAIEAADVVIMTDKPSRIAPAMQVARRTMSIVRQNIVFALTIKVAVMFLGAIGFADMWWAVFADVGVSLLAILNALRALRVSKKALG